MDTVFVAAARAPVAGLPRRPVGVLRLGEGVLPDEPPLLRRVSQADPVELAGGKEAGQGGLPNLDKKTWFGL